MAIKANVHFDHQGKDVEALVYPTVPPPFDLVLFILFWPVLIVLFMGVTTGELRVDNRVLGRWRWNFARYRELTGTVSGSKLGVRLNLFRGSADLLIDDEVLETKALRKLPKL